MAVQLEHLESIDLLCSRGADVEKTARRLGDCPTSPLRFAALHNRWKAAEILLRHGASVHAYNPSNGCSALAIAVGQGSAETCRLLLNSSADPTRTFPGFPDNPNAFELSMEDFDGARPEGFEAREGEEKINPCTPLLAEWVRQTHELWKEDNVGKDASEMMTPSGCYLAYESLRRIAIPQTGVRSMRDVGGNHAVLTIVHEGDVFVPRPEEVEEGNKPKQAESQVEAKRGGEGEQKGVAAGDAAAATEARRAEIMANVAAARKAKWPA